MGLLRKLKDGKRVYGTCFTVTSPSWPLSLQKAGLDFAFIDNEHISMNRADLARLCQVINSYGISPIVRIPSPDPYLASQAIDAGAVGVVAPYLESVEQIRQLVGAVKYKPLKGKVLERVLNGEGTLDEKTRAYVEKANAGKMAIANIESVPAMNKLDDLLSVPGLDAVFIGPHDLSVSLGHPEEYDHPAFEAAVKKIIEVARGKGLAVGIHFSLEPERQIRWAKEGANIIVHSFDIALFTQRLIRDIAIIKEGVGDRVSGNQSGDMIV
ncbi:MAG TPA: aldolase/citrate lyase family protein [Chryseosolibacter sp.]|nr:aldolase/citrate lyase family protein [Chryseosolibacter sp.]